MSGRGKERGRKGIEGWEGGRKWERDQGEKQIGEREEIEEDAFTEKGREGKRGEHGGERGEFGGECATHEL